MTTKITKVEFDALLLSVDAARIIQELGVDVIGLVDLSEYMFKVGAEISFADFMELIMAELQNSTT
jgi:hypothetical protein